jgi:GPH family glycoside/pentoside/hexuronide:cation symporter
MKEKGKGTILGLAERLGYAAISIADNLRSSYLNTFMLFFCTNVLGCRPGILATLMSICTVWDAINDPMIASYADNHPNRNGDRSRQYLFASIPAGIVLVLLFSHLFQNPTASLIFVFALYLLLSVFSTFHRLPFYTMMILVSPEEEDRLSVSKFHFFGTAICEVGLTGDVRTVGQMNARLKECLRLGYTNVLVPEGVRTDLLGLKLTPIRNVLEAASLIAYPAE